MALGESRVQHRPLPSSQKTAALTVAFDGTLRSLGIVDENDRLRTDVAILIIELARNGVRDADKLAPWP
jgi:hypothetical protein